MDKKIFLLAAFLTGCSPDAGYLLGRMGAAGNGAESLYLYERAHLIQTQHRDIEAPVIIPHEQQAIPSEAHPQTWMLNQNGRTYLCNNIGGSVNCN